MQSPPETPSPTTRTVQDSAWEEALSKAIPSDEPTTTVRINHRSQTNVIGVYKTYYTDEPATQTPSGVFPDYHIITTDPSQRIITTNAKGETCTGCQRNRQTKPGTGIPVISMNEIIATRNCLHANIAEQAVQLGQHENIVGGEPCSNCESWEFTTQTTQETVQGGKAKLNFTQHLCSDCESHREVKTI